MEHGKKVKRDMTRKSGRTVGSILTAVAMVLLNAVPAMAASEQHPDWYTFYDGAEHWSVFSIGRELGQLICLILTKILDFIEKDVYGAVFNSGATFFKNITQHTIFGDKGFGYVVTAFLVVGLVSYGVWILLHTEQTSNSPRYFVRQIVALVGTIILVPAMMGSMWSMAAGSWRKATEGAATEYVSNSNKGKATTEATALSASAECLNDNITDWYWMAGKGAIKSNVNSDSTDTAGGNDNAGGSDAGKDSARAPRGEILWDATKAVKTVNGKKEKGYANTCNPWLGYAGWEMIDPMQYITKDGVDDYNETVDKDKIDQMTAKLKARYAKYGKKNSIEARKIYYEEKYYENLAKSGSYAQQHNDDKKDKGGEIPTDTRDKVFVVTESGASIKAANGGDGPLKALFKGGLVNPPYYRYTINWLPMIIELAALAVFLFMISLKVLRIMFDTIITGIVAPLFVSMDFWGESGQRTKTIYRSIVNGFLSIGALVLEVEFFEVFCYEISHLNLGIPWYGAGFVKSLMYLAIGYIGVKGADIFKKMGLDVDNSATLQAGKNMVKAGALAGHKAKEGALKAAGLAGGALLAAQAKPFAALKKPKPDNPGIQKGKGGKGENGQSGNNAFASLAKTSPLKANEKAIPDDMKSGGKGDVPIGKTKGDDQQKDAITAGSDDQKNAISAGANDPNNEQTKALEQDVNGSEETANVGGGANDDTAKVSDGDTGKIDAGAMTFQPDAGNEPQGVEGQQSDDVSSLQEGANLDENSLPAGQSAAGQNDSNLPKQEQSSEVNGHTSAPGVVGGETPKQSAGEKPGAGKPGMENTGGGAKDVGAGDKPNEQVEQPKANAGSLNSNSGNSGVYQPTRKEPGRDSMTAEQASERLSASAKQSRAGTNSAMSDTATTANTVNNSSSRFAATATDSIPTNTSATPIGGTGTSNLNGANAQDSVPVGGYQPSSGTNGSGGVNRRVNNQAVSMGDDANVSLNAGKGSNITIQQSGTSGSESTHGDTHPNGALKSGTTNVPHVEGESFGYQSPHSTGQRAAMESRYGGKGTLGQATASAYGHTMAAANNVVGAVQSARRNRAQYINANTGHVQHLRAAKATMRDIKDGFINSKQQEYAGYMEKGEEKYGGGGKGTTSREEQYVSLADMDDVRTDANGEPERAPHQFDDDN